MAVCGSVGSGRGVLQRPKLKHCPACVHAFPVAQKHRVNCGAEKEGGGGEGEDAMEVVVMVMMVMVVMVLKIESRVGIPRAVSIHAPVYVCPPDPAD